MNKGPVCTICVHPKQAEIDAARGGLVRVAARFGISKSALDRHKKHAAWVKSEPQKPTVPPPPLTPTTAIEALDKAMARVAQEMVRCAMEDIPRQTKAWNDLQRAREEAMKKIEITEDQIVASAWWGRFKDRLEVALRPYPDAARALMQALTEAA